MYNDLPYNEGANMIAESLGLKMKIIDIEYKNHFTGDTTPRYVFKIQLSKGG